MKNSIEYATKALQLTDKSIESNSTNEQGTRKVIKRNTNTEYVGNLLA